jgi:hypothetical protein
MNEKRGVLEVGKLRRRVVVRKWSNCNSSVTKW